MLQDEPFSRFASPPQLPEMGLSLARTPTAIAQNEIAITENTKKNSNINDSSN